MLVHKTNYLVYFKTFLPKFCDLSDKYCTQYKIFFYVNTRKYSKYNKKNKNKY